MARDPRVEDNAENIRRLRESVLRLASIVDGLAWRISSTEEKRGLDVAAEILAVLNKKR